MSNISRPFCVHATIVLAALVAAAAPLYAQSPQPEKAPSWPELTPEVHAKMIEKLKAFSNETKEKVNGSLRLLETKYFVFYTDLPSAEARKWAYLLDKMYNRLCDLFGIKKGTNIWYGKSLILVFSKQEDYNKFWAVMMDVNPRTSAGMCYSYGDGRVVIAFYRQPHEMDFATVLVHESVHGFLHRYRSPARIVSWINEGLAEVIAYELVPKGTWIPRKQQQAKKEMKKHGNMGGDFFIAEHINGWQYGAASGLTAYMIKQHKKGYVAFINGIKNGTSWEESLATNYGVALKRLVHFYGKSIGIKSLVP